jgi:hypothetical protein
LRCTGPTWLPTPRTAREHLSHVIQKTVLQLVTPYGKY